MIPIWYGVVAFMLIAYVVLDGRNFGAGMLHRYVPGRRRNGPGHRRDRTLWSWHEVWLVGFGACWCVFPRLMASAFAGYYSRSC